VFRFLQDLMLYYLAVTIYVLVCLTLMLVVLLQQGKGGSMASAFGGGGSSQAAFGARSGATVLSRATTVCAVLFIVGALLLGIMRQRGPGSVVGGRAAPQTQQSPSSSPAVPPATPAPAPAPAEKK
jgi:preprotein translocase subunit SecG